MHPKVKVWTKHRTCKKVLQATLNDLLEQLESRPPITLELTSNSVDVRLKWLGGLLHEAESPTPSFSFDAMKNSAKVDTGEICVPTNAVSGEEAGTTVTDEYNEISPRM